MEASLAPLDYGYHDFGAGMGDRLFLSAGIFCRSGMRNDYPGHL